MLSTTIETEGMKNKKEEKTREFKRRISIRNSVSMGVYKSNEWEEKENRNLRHFVENSYL